MTKAIFMKELEELLYDISLEERENALRYYEDYFADAGIEKEDDIILELGSPKRVAKIIKSELYANSMDNGTSGIYTENGYQSTNYEEDKYEVFSGEVESDGKGEKDSKDRNTQYENSKNNSYNEYYSNQENDRSHNDRKDYNDYQNYRNQDYSRNNEDKRYNEDYNRYYTEKEKRGPNILLIILLIIFGLPIGLPVICTGFVLLLAFGVIIASLFIGFFVAGIGMSIGGIVAIIIGVITLFTLPMNGALICGSGMIVLGLGILFTILSMQLIKVVLPGVVRGVVNILRIPFRNRRFAV